MVRTAQKRKLQIAQQRSLSQEYQRLQETAEERKNESDPDAAPKSSARRRTSARLSPDSMVFSLDKQCAAEGAPEDTSLGRDEVIAEEAEAALVAEDDAPELPSSVELVAADSAYLQTQDIASTAPLSTAEDNCSIGPYIDTTLEIFTSIEEEKAMLRAAANSEDMQDVYKAILQL